MSILHTPTTCEMQVSPAAALLFAPTLVWVTIAAKLNWDIVQLNAAEDSGSDKKK